MKKIIKQYIKTVTVELDDRDRGYEELNLFYLGERNCNHRKDGKYVAKYPEFEKEHPEFGDAHCAIRRSYKFKVAVNLMEDGTLQLAKESDEKSESPGVRLEHD